VLLTSEEVRCTLCQLLKEYDAGGEGCQSGDCALSQEDLACGDAVKPAILALLGAPHFRLQSTERGQRRSGSSEVGRGASGELVLTASGAEFIRYLLGEVRGGKPEESGDRPRWDRMMLQLWWRGECIREYRNDAANQRLVLDGFEEHRWPRRLADPLPRERGVNVKVRLRETIKGLNRGQKPQRLCFRGDGTGLGVVWEESDKQARI
jgi:hypothetical protein